MRITNRLALTPLALSLLLFNPPCRAGETDALERIAAVVDAAIRPVMREHKIPGLAVAVTRGGKRYFFNYGVESRETRQPVTSETIFELGSISKTFTATVAGYAQVKGALVLTDPASKYLPALRGSRFDKISLLELGTYTAGGLPLQFPDEVNDHPETIRYFRNWQPAFAPGTRRLYSNPSIGLFGFLAAKSLDVPFAEFLEKNIFPQLGLTHTYVNVPAAQMRHYAQGYSKADTPIRVSPGPFDAEAYGVKTGSADMVRFLEANMNGVSLDTQLQAAITATHTGYFAAGNMTQALGWEWYPWPLALDALQAGNAAQMLYQPNEVTRLNPPRLPPNDALINKTGSTNGFGAYVAFIPAMRLGIVLLANRNYPIPARVKAAHAILVALEEMTDRETAPGKN